jgi:hypothetical protein
MSRACGFFTLLLLAATVSGAEGSFPYAAAVASSKAVVRSGAGAEFYETDKLAKGDEVEVHRHDSDGWCAIRPPAKSFSWVPARYLKVGTPDVPASVGVVEKRVASRIGSNLSAARSTISVYLEPGELVEIVEVVEGGSKPWYKISPPSGEFRWIHKRFLAADAVVNAGGEKEDRGSRIEEDTPKEETVAAAPKVEKKWTSKAASARLRGSDVSQKATPTPSSKPSAKASADKTKPEVASKTATATEKEKQKDAEPSITIQLIALNLRLASEVALEPRDWELAPLRDEVNKLLEAATLADDRSRAQVMLERIARFEDLRRRRHMIEGVASTTEAEKTLATKTEESKGEPIDNDPRFDGAGKLVTIHSNKPEAPQYALTDEANRVVMLISPSPGVNLQAHVGSHVGIRGIRGYSPDVDKPHLTAQRVTSLSRRQ